MYDFIVTAFKVVVGVITNERLAIAALLALGILVLWVTFSLIFSFQNKFAKRARNINEYVSRNGMFNEAQAGFENLIKAMPYEFQRGYSNYKDSSDLPSKHIKRFESLDVELTGGVFNQNKSIIKTYINFIFVALLVFSLGVLSVESPLTGYMLAEAAVIPLCFLLLAKITYYVYTAIRQYQYKNAVDEFNDMLDNLDECHRNYYKGNVAAAGDTKGIMVFEQQVASRLDDMQRSLNEIGYNLESISDGRIKVNLTENGKESIERTEIEDNKDESQRKESYRIVNSPKKYVDEDDEQNEEASEEAYSASESNIESQVEASDDNIEDQTESKVDFEETKEETSQINGQEAERTETSQESAGNVDNYVESAEESVDENVENTEENINEEVEDQKLENEANEDEIKTPENQVLESAAEEEKAEDEDIEDIKVKEDIENTEIGGGEQGETQVVNEEKAGDKQDNFKLDFASLVAEEAAETQTKRGRGRPKKEVNQTGEFVIKNDKDFEEALVRAEKLMRKNEEPLSASQTKRIEKQIKQLVDAMTKYKEQK